MLYNIKNKYNQAHKEKWEMLSISHFHLNFIEPIHLAILLPRPQFIQILYFQVFN